MTLNEARTKSLLRLRKPASLRAVAAELACGDARDRSRAEAFTAKARRIEREQTEAFAAALKREIAVDA